MKECIPFVRFGYSDQGRVNTRNWGDNKAKRAKLMDGKPLVDVCAR